MSTKPRTIDNMGIDISVRYAKDQELVESKLLKGAEISKRAQVSITTPSYPLEIEELLGYGVQHRTWARFLPPQLYTSHTRQLFTYQLIPSIGPLEKMQAELEKITTLPEEKKNKKESQEDKEKRDKKKKNQQIIIALLQNLIGLERDLRFIKSKRNQYHKG